MNFNLVKMFRQAMERREARIAQEAHFREAMAAIRDGNLADVTRILDAVKFHHRQEDELLIQAIHYDNTDIFDAVLKKTANGNTNYKLSHHVSFGPEGPSHYEVTPLLSMALNRRSYNVAMVIAENPKTDVTACGKTTRYGMSGGGYFTTGQIGTEDTKHESPYEIAKKDPEGARVLAVIARRLADIHREEAQRLIDESAFLGMR